MCALCTYTCTYIYIYHIRHMLKCLHVPGLVVEKEHRCHCICCLACPQLHSQHSLGFPIASTALAFHQVKGQFRASIEPAGSILGETHEMTTSWKTSLPSLIK